MFTLLPLLFCVIPPDIYVEVHTPEGVGSGIIIVREVDGQLINLVWTARHVIESALISNDIVVEHRFWSKGILIILRSSAEIVKSWNTVDLALLLIRGPPLITQITDEVFYFGKVDKKDTLVHFGLYGGALNYISIGHKETFFPQIFGYFESNEGLLLKIEPGCSGGGVFRNDRCIGLVLARNILIHEQSYMLPALQIYHTAYNSGLLWALFPRLSAPTMNQIRHIQNRDYTFYYLFSVALILGLWLYGRRSVKVTRLNFNSTS